MVLLVPGVDVAGQCPGAHAIHQNWEALMTLRHWRRRSLHIMLALALFSWGAVIAWMVTGGMG